MSNQTPIDKKYQGLFAYRYKDNPLEYAFAKEWEKQHGPENMELLRGILGFSVTERDRDVANTVIQWLGSPVGQSFIIAATSKALSTRLRTAVLSARKPKKKKAYDGADRGARQRT